MLIYPSWFVGLLEMPRILYLCEARYFPVADDLPCRYLSDHHGGGTGSEGGRPASAAVSRLPSAVTAQGSVETTSAALAGHRHRRARRRRQGNAGAAAWRRIWASPISTPGCCIGRSAPGRWPAAAIRPWQRARAGRWPRPISTIRRCGWMRRRRRPRGSPPIPAVREALLEFQRRFAAAPPGGARGAVLDGRDIGTVVCPDATLKLFVTASLEERAARRLKELRERGSEAIDSRVLRDMQERDARDFVAQRRTAGAGRDAVVIDTSGLGPDAVFAAALAAWQARVSDGLADMLPSAACLQWRDRRRHGTEQAPARCRGGFAADDARPTTGRLDAEIRGRETRIEEAETDDRERSRHHHRPHVLPARRASPPCWTRAWAAPRASRAGWSRARSSPSRTTWWWSMSA